jgi:hypothetical protein
MKKITFLLLTILPLIGFGQTITNTTFDTDVSGWSQNGGTISWNATEGSAAAGSLELISTATGNRAQSNPNAAPVSGPGDYTLTFKVKGPAGVNFKGSIFQSSNGGFQNGTTGNQILTGGWDTYVASTFTVDGGNMNIRLIADDAGTFYIDDIEWTYVPPTGNTLTVNTVGAGSVALTLDQISYAPTDVETLTANPATHWSFDSWSGNLTGSTNPETLLMDADKTVTANFTINPSFDYAFTFDTDGDLESWETDPQLAVASHTGGQVTLTPTTDQWARFNLFDFPIPTASYNKVTITLQNLSTNDDQLGFIVVNGSTEVVTQAMTTSDVSIQTYVFDATQFTNWTGDIQSVRVRFTDADNPTSGRSSGTGNIIIDDIVFEFDASLSSKDFKTLSFSLYPNPAKNVLNINSINKISKVTIFEITGKRVLEAKELTDSKINISQINTGIYIVKIQDEFNNISTKKLVID